jgi:hypothetical protein
MGREPRRRRAAGRHDRQVATMAPDAGGPACPINAGGPGGQLRHLLPRRLFPNGTRAAAFKASITVLASSLLSHCLTIFQPLRSPSSITSHLRSECRR